LIAIYLDIYPAKVVWERRGDARRRGKGSSKIMWARSYINIKRYYLAAGALSRSSIRRRTYLYYILLLLPSPYIVHTAFIMQANKTQVFFMSRSQNTHVT